jgi:hypothetical protein
VLDVLGMKELIAEPRSLYDAWVKSIIVPLTAIAEDDIKLFERESNLHMGLKSMHVSLRSNKSMIPPTCSA